MCTAHCLGPESFRVGLLADLGNKRSIGSTRVRDRGMGAGEDASFGGRAGRCPPGGSIATAELKRIRAACRSSEQMLIRQSLQDTTEIVEVDTHLSMHTVWSDGSGRSSSLLYPSRGRMWSSACQTDNITRRFPSPHPRFASSIGAVQRHGLIRCVRRGPVCEVDSLARGWFRAVGQDAQVLGACVAVLRPAGAAVSPASCQAVTPCSGKAVACSAFQDNETDLHDRSHVSFFPACPGSAPPCIALPAQSHRPSRREALLIATH